MTTASQARLDQLILTVFGAGTAPTQLETVRSLYAEVYAEPPYYEGSDEAEDFSSSWQVRAGQLGFRLVIAHHAEESVGFAFGHQLSPRTPWWNGALTPLPDDLTKEYPGRTFAIVEIAVRRSYRRRGVARELHNHLTAGLSEERITLLVRPDAPPAKHAYRSWGYEKVGQIQPFTDGPVYDAMVKGLAVVRAT